MTNTSFHTNWWGLAVEDSLKKGGNDLLQVLFVVCVCFRLLSCSCIFMFVFDVSAGVTQMEGKQEIYILFVFVFPASFVVIARRVQRYFNSPSHRVCMSCSKLEFSDTTRS